jgi:hypothetical protein
MPAFGGFEEITDVADGGDEAIEGAGGGLAQVCLQLGEGPLDRVQVGRVLGQEEEPGAAPAQGGLGLALLWTERLSRMTTSPRARVGASWVST